MKFDPFTDELLKLDSDVNKAVTRYFGNLSHEEILTDLLSDSEHWAHIDSDEKLSCAIALNSTGQAMTAAVGGRWGDMVKYISHANKHLGVCFERSETRNEFSEKQRNRAKSKRRNPLDDLIKKILARFPDATTPEVLNLLRREECGQVIDEITADEIIYYNGKKLVPAKISGLDDRVSKLRKK